MALLRLAEWILLSRPEQGSLSCNDKIPPRADETEISPGSTPGSLGSVSRTDSAASLRCVDKDARPSVACDRRGAER